MKILHVTPSYFPAVIFGGPIKSVHLLNKSLVEKGIEVDVFTTNAGLEHDKTIQLKAWRSIDGVRTKYFPYTGYIHYNFSVSLLKQLLENVKNYDIVHVTAVWNFPVLASAFACKKNKIPYIISPRGTIYPETIAIKSGFIKRLYLKLFGNYCLNNASALHFTSDDEGERVMEYLKLKSPVKTIFNGVDLNVNQVSSTSHDLNLIFRGRYILFLGRINRKKGLDLLLKSFSVIHNSYPDIKLIIAGPDNDDYKKYLIKIAKILAIDSRVFFTGILNGEVKEEAFKNALMFILPSYSENFGMTVPEAMLYKTPVIITNKVGIYPLVERYNAGIVIPPDADKLAKAIDEILNNPELKEVVVNNALRLVKTEFNIDNISGQFIDFYQSVINSN